MDYKNGKIYALRSPHTDQVYIGSTTQPLSKRFYHHKASYKAWKIEKGLYTYSYKILEAGDAYIELIKDYPCNSKRELNREEGVIMRETQNCCNKRVEGRTKKEYRKDNKKEIKEHLKEWREDHKEEIREYNKQYREDEDHKEKMREYQKQYQKEKVGCRACKSMITKKHFKEHERTKKHQDNINHRNKDE